ncbi:hypothetical protein SAMN04488123_1215 [Natribacillus halophilus]|uniref:DUF4351 domain-containing protein n=2 Tax=Natribacillus halophilus TaxID=549003 RepID=A0A1G8RX70_9BACI|nr:hypothetical protein SAMN04488123_1215 [Natribacillus halophilus]
MELMTSYERRGLEKGKQDAICTVLEEKFESSTDAEQEKIRSIDHLESLDDLLKQLLSAETLEHAQVIIEQAENK